MVALIVAGCSGAVAIPTPTPAATASGAGPNVDTDLFGKANETGKANCRRGFQATVTAQKLGRPR